MVLNGKKTVVVPITGRKAAVPVVSLTSPDDGSMISTSKRMKLLGITISSDGLTEEHVQATATKARKRIWMMRHLKSAGVSQLDCLKIYYTTIRSCLEYAAEAMGPMMTMIQSDEYEGVQRLVLKCIFGYDKHYADILQVNNIPTLLERRENRIRNFARKLQLEPKVKSWFPPPPLEVKSRLRNVQSVREFHANTCRYFYSPIPTYRRLMNNPCSRPSRASKVL